MFPIPLWQKNIFMKKQYLHLLLLLSISTFAQIKGVIKDQKGNPLPYVTISVENTYNATTSNEQGKYELNTKLTGKQTLIFQFLGFKTKKETIEIDKLPYVLDEILVEQQFTLNEVVINKKGNPANAIIKKAITSRKENATKTAKFTADFYSRGIFRIKNLPKKILGQKIDLGEDFGSNLDSTGSGILYLSETVSKITFEKPDNFKEKIIASKISGNSRGYSYNTAKNTFYDFYDNTLNFGAAMISPIANNAFNYYKYKLEGTFFDSNNQEINKIKVIAKRDKEPVFEGYMYIVSDSWAIYAVDLDIKGYRMGDEFTEVMNLKQNFSYNVVTKIWSKSSQSLGFTAGGFGIKFSGKFNYVYSNYDFKNAFEKNTFSNEILSIEENANKKDSIFWNNRPIPLTDEESNDYYKKDRLLLIRKSQKYLDSVDIKHNKFKFMSPILGYNYKNSFQKWSFDYKGLLDLESFSFNTVQGFNLGSGFSFKKWNDENGKNTSINAIVNYGFSEKTFRPVLEYNHRFNNQNYGTLTISAGSKVVQFNPENPIKSFINDETSLFYKNNFMKLYNLEFAKIMYSQDVLNGINLNEKLEYLQRSPLFNNTSLSYTKIDKSYSSNNPIDKNDYINPGFERNSLAKISLNAKINFGNKYISRPDGKFNIANEKLPTLYFGYEKTFGASDKKYEFSHINTRITYDVMLGNKGKLAINTKAGKFFNAQNISFMDYKHFNGNQTNIGTSENYLNVFNLLPYYTNSTNDAYFESHLEYNDKGFVMNKIPLLNKLKSNLVFGLHNLAVPKLKPYQEFSIGLDNLGFGKFKFFRLDYVQSYQNGVKNNGFVVGLEIFNF